MPIDPYAALHALLRAEAVRTAPHEDQAGNQDQKHGQGFSGETKPEARPDQDD
ncbi:hypothetical protein [Streptomyces sp. NPDC052114]|uniref:hypothetical protein n=1 Tax=unclassified Streptomyces TaxID=2593676 RepID=UPI0034343369